MAALDSVIMLFLSFSMWALCASGSALQGKIVNGTQAYDGEFPFVVSLRRAKSGGHSCGASLINRAWVLTAAHCVHRASPAQINIQFGSNELQPSSTNVSNVSAIFVHEGYFPGNQYIHDIALLKLVAPITFSAKVHEVRLPRFEKPTPGDAPAVLIGWGLNATGGSVQRYLQKVHLQTFSDSECSERHQAHIHPTTICAGVPEGGKGQCSGDSGGPLLVNDTQIGIVSWSRKPCAVAPYPGVFTEISAYIDWIWKTMGDAYLSGDGSDESLEDHIIAGDLITVT